MLSWNILVADFGNCFINIVVWWEMDKLAQILLIRHTLVEENRS